MIKSIVRSLIFLIVLSAGGMYLLYITTGSLPSLSGFSSKGEDESVDLRRLSEMPSLNSVEASSNTHSITKWQDEEGVWHFCNLPDSSPKSEKNH